jgi:hypothetical protein
MKVRVVSTASKANAVQVVNYHNYKRIILKHIGSAHDKEELDELILVAEEWIKDYSGQLSIFPDENPNNLLFFNHSTFIGVKYRFFYDTIHKLIDMLGLQKLPEILNDLVVIRIFEPSSKLRSLELIEQYFGIKHNRKSYYKIAPKCIELKRDVEKNIISFVESLYAGNLFDLYKYDMWAEDPTTTEVVIDTSDQYESKNGVRNYF